MIQKYGLFWSLFSAFFGMFDSPKQRGYPLWEGTENSSQFEAIKLAISDYPEYPLFMCSKSTLFGRPWCNKKPPWIHDSGRVKKHHNWIRNLLDYVGMRPTSEMMNADKKKQKQDGETPKDQDEEKNKRRGGPHTYINCDPIFNIFGAFESWFQQRFLLHKGKKNSSHFGSPKVAILDDPEKWPFLIPIQCLFWNVWFIKTAGVAAMRRDGK